MMTISLELPPGVAAPTIRGTLTGPPDDLRIEIRLADFIEAIKRAQAAGATVQMVPNGVHIDTAEPPKPSATEGQKRWNNRQPPPPLKTAAADPPKNAGPYVPAPGTAPDLVMKALEKKPASSLELTAQYPTVSAGSLYQAVKFLREKGMVEGFEDEIDGTRRWRLVQKQTA